MADKTQKGTRQIAAETKLANDRIEALKAEYGTLNGIFNMNQKNYNLQEQAYEKQRLVNLAKEDYILSAKKGNALEGDAMAIKKQNLDDAIKANKEAEKGLKTQKTRNELLKHYTTEFGKAFDLQAGWLKNLMESDKVIRQTILNLGMSGKKADAMRGSFEKSAMAVAQMGGSLADIQTVMQGYADETGRARVLTAQMVTDIIEIGRGTGLGVEAATKMGAQFELMGYDAKNVNKTVQGFVDSTERMGVNTTKVFKGVNDNFKRLQTYSFQGGVKGMLTMSQYATKMNIDMNQALNAADASKTLENAIGLAAQLQVMGGEFAKTDPFQLLFLARNDPAEYTKKINEMTKGVVTFRKMTDGTFEKFISPADRDRMAAVEKSLGMQTGQLTEQALRMADIQKMRQNMLATSLSKKDKEGIEGAAIFNKETGTFQVQIAGIAKNITELTQAEAQAFISQEVTLKKRAKDSLTFEEALAATMASFKTVLLPMLRGINGVMKVVMPVFEFIAKALSKIPTGIIIAAGVFTGAAVLIVKAAAAMSRAYFFATGKNVLGNAGGAGAGAMGGGMNAAGNNAGNVSRNYGRGALLKGQGQQAAGKGAMMKGAGVGMAAVGIGAGIGLAAVGISQLAKSIKDVDVDKLKQMSWMVGLLGTTMAVSLVGGILAVGTATTFTAPALLALGATALMIGGGIGIASAGIGFMAKGLGDLVTSAKGAGPSLLDIAGGITAIGAAGFSAGILGTIGLASTLGTISGYAEPLGKVGAAFREINLAMSGSKDDYIAIENAVKSISNMNTNGASTIAQLAQLLKSPLKVEFSDKKVSFVSDITMNIDGQKFMQKVYSHETALTRGKAAKDGQEKG